MKAISLKIATNNAMIMTDLFWNFGECTRGGKKSSVIYSLQLYKPAPTPKATAGY